MIISFIRHGESEANVLRILSSKAEERYNLTEKGVNQIKEAALSINGKIDAIYSSPLLRTLQSSKIIIDNRIEKLDLIVDERIAEINYGKYIGKKNNEELDEVRRRQIAGDYEIRFGDFGENKREILKRICTFLIDAVNNHDDSQHIVVVSHGTIITLAELLISKLKNSPKEHSHTGNASIKTLRIDKSDLVLIQKTVDDLNSIKRKEVNRRIKIVKKKFKYFHGINKSVQDQYLRNYMKIAKAGIDNLELTYEVLDLLTDGFYKSDMKLVQSQIGKTDISKSDVILVCAFKNAKEIVRVFIEHYAKIGIKNFVLIDNASTDESFEIIRDYPGNINVDVWFVNDRFDSFKSCGWRQRMMANYGLDKWYLDLDVDELLVYTGIEDGGIKRIIEYAQKNKLQTVGSFLLDVYADKPVLSVKDAVITDIQKTYKYIDFDTYFKVDDENYKYRIFGGPRKRKFNISPSLQKFPLVYIRKDTMNVNPHFWYPFSINFNSELASALLHYKFLPGDFDQYKDYVKTGVHWNNSSEYRVYVNELQNNLGFTFFDDEHSIEFIDSRSLVKIKTVDDAYLLTARV